MTAEEVRQLILDDLKSAGLDPTATLGSHRLDLARCLVVAPRKELVWDSFGTDSELSVWLVLQEDPEGQSGYNVVYDEHEGFGLAAPSPRGPVVIGYYESFVDALNAM